MNRRTLLRAAAATVVVTAGGSPAGTPGGTATNSQSQTGTKATVELANGGTFTFTLRPDKAPQTVARFAEKSRSGFYNDKIFHRVEDWVVQGGDPPATRSGGERR